MFTREYHQAIAQVLYALDGELLLDQHCLFGGGTAIALRYGEYRESVDIDFLVSSRDGYRELRELARNGLPALCRRTNLPFEQTRDIRIDQYGIRTMLSVVGREIKFEIILEGRVELEEPGPDDTLCGIATLSALDMATSKLLANADRCYDDGIFNRDIIDLAMMKPTKALLENAVTKARAAYGDAVLRDLAAAIRRIETREGWMERCMDAMAIGIPKAVLWKHIRALKKVLTNP
ncbi:MAG: nucleotidyl transferase AbiEii/AbiGii toxin family protein [Gammaproteobacteria bacterium]|nr:nucleotidyl transferase AbiEii/AbiGii toxin family protein [Gammaproteobacteria bacterium]